MAIDINNINNLQARTAEKPSASKSDSAGSPLDSEAENSVEAAESSVQLSDRAKNFQRLTDEMEKLPVVDTDRVESIRQSLAAGTYEIDSAKTAEQLLSKEGFSFSNDS